MAKAKVWAAGSSKTDIYVCSCCRWQVGWYGRLLWGRWLFPFALKTSQYLKSNRGCKHSSPLPLSISPSPTSQEKTSVLFALPGSRESVLPPYLTGGCWQPYLSMPWRLKMDLPAKASDGSSPAASWWHALWHCKMQVSAAAYLLCSPLRTGRLGYLLFQRNTRTLEQRGRRMLGSALNSAWPLA